MNARTLALVTLLVLLVGLAVAPWRCFTTDMVEYWVPWQLATGGWRPWGAYVLPKCNYPPVVLYLMTPLEALRSAAGIEPAARLNWLLIKLPNLLAIPLGALVLYRATRARLGERRAAALGAAWALSPALFVNAAVWGQWDVLMSLTLVLATIALARGRALWVGVWLAATLLMKVQAIFAIPILGFALLVSMPGFADRFDAGRAGRSVAAAALGAFLAAAVLCAPFALAGRLGSVWGVYTASVDTFPRRSMDAWNGWALANGVDARVRHMPQLVANDDGRPVISSATTGPLRKFTFKRLGQAMFALYVLAILATMARRRRAADAIVGLPLCGLAMFMLCTQMHERYAMPSAALMTLWLLYARPWRWQFYWWTLSSALNQLGAMYQKGHLVAHPVKTAYEVFGAAFSVGNVLMFLWLSWLYFRRPAATIDPSRDAIVEAVN